VPQIIPNNQITLLQNGEAYFPAIEAALDRAVYEIYLESYILKNDHTGQRIAGALRRAAFRGVKTHLPIDGFGSHSLPKTMVDYLSAAGVMVLKFRPKTSPWTLRRRRFENKWRTQTIRLRLASWLSYGLVRFMVGMAGYAPGKQSARNNRSISIISYLTRGKNW